MARWLPSMLLALLFALGACASSPPPAPEDEHVDFVPYPYPEEVKAEFMGSCVGEGGPPETCACTLEKLQYNVPLDRIAANDVDPALLESLVVECLEGR